MRPPSLKKIVQFMSMLIVFLVVRRFMKPREKLRTSDPQFAPKPFIADDLTVKEKTKIVVRK